MRLIIFFGIFWICSLALAQDATSGLYVCTDSQGMNNIVTQTQLSTTKGQCKPYVKGMFRAKLSSNNEPRHHAPQSQTGANIKSPSNGLSSLGRRIQLKTPTDSNAMVDSSAKMDTIPPTNHKEEQRVLPPAIKTTYLCPKSNATHEIIEATEAPDDSCIPFSSQNTHQSDTTLSTQKNTQLSKPTNSSAKITALATPPQDIYKCFDRIGRASYVGEKERHKFKRCTFFSKSFAGAQEDLKRKATTDYTLAELAASGVNSGLNSNASLQCTGAGKIEFNGKVKVYNCAARSFNYSPGSSGGSIRLGDQQAIIAAHRLNYFDSAGSCGGTVLAENGRLLHLEPTKECPKAFKIEAKRIAKIVEHSLSVNVSGAFKERQRALTAQINKIAAEVGVDPFLIHAVISAESAYKSKAVSHAGAQGLMQLMPATAKRFGVTDPFHTGQNIRGGTTYLKWLLKEFNGNLELAIAGYNAGEGNVRKYGYKVPPFIETRAYVPKVLEYYRRYRSSPSEVGL